jgi:hypothetical protein
MRQRHDEKKSTSKLDENLALRWKYTGSHFAPEGNCQCWIAAFGCD